MTYRNRYILTLILILAALLASGNAMAQSSEEPEEDPEEETQTGVVVRGNVYGGGNLGDVGIYSYDSSTRSYNYPQNTGICTVHIYSGTIGAEGKSTVGHASGHVFGAGKGLEDTFECDKAMVYKASVTIDNGTVYGNVYGGGQVGRVENDTEVTIGDGDGVGEGTETQPTSTPEIKGNVFGAGAGVETHGYSALVRNNSEVTVQGNATVGHTVYGGGEIAAVGKYGLNSEDMPEELKGGGDCRVTVKGYALIGSSGEGHVFGAGMGVNPFDATHNYIDFITDSEDKDSKPKRMRIKPGEGKTWPDLYTAIAGTNYIWEYYTSQDAYFNFLQTLALATDSYVTIEGNAKVHGSVFGGSESGFVQRETDVKIQGSCEIFTITDTDDNTIEGNVFGGGKGLSGFDKAGRVRGNATTTISGSSTVNGNVYGGGALGYVGKFEEDEDDYGKIYNWPEIETQTTGQTQTTGLCIVDISGTSTVAGNVFGGGKGEAETFECLPAMTRTTSVTISAGTVGGNVYGGGEVGRVDQHTVVTIGDGANEGAGVANSATPAPEITGSVFGAGAGVETHGYSALVRGNATVTIQGNAQVGKSVYGGGQIASVGRYALDKFQMPSLLVAGGICTVTVKGYTKIGTDNGGNVFGACKGVDPNDDEHDYIDFTNSNTSNKDNKPKRMMRYSAGFVSGKTEHVDWDYYDDPTFIWDYLTTTEKYSTYLETLALATEPRVTINGNADVNGDVYGGGERGLTKGSVTVTINGGTIANDVYGGGALANTNISNWKKYGGDTPNDDSDDYWSWEDTENKTAKYTTTVNLHGGVIGHNVYGGGLGQKYKAATSTQAEKPAIAALVYGDVLVQLNETTATDNCVVKNVIHGANNINGSPLGKVTVHIYKTQGWTDDNGTPDDDTDDVPHVVDKSDPDAVRTNTTYELKAVYGGGNEAAYDTESYYPDGFDSPANTDHKAHVIIDGCDLTSIETVYGGGNAASAPATHVEVNSCYEIGTVFGGGNGKDNLSDGTANPGAHVGYLPYSYAADATETEINAAKAAAAYGTGKALAELKGGTIHHAFGGSNTKGNVRVSALVDLNEPENNPCPLHIDEVYGAGNEAYQDGTSNINLGCISYLKELYGGSKNADINNSIDLTIQSGTFDRVFGGNNVGGVISGTITVNIEETGCHPIIIGQLYGGGNKAAYTAPSGQNGPTLNVKSFTSIGEIYGGGYGSGAKITGDTYVYINECVGKNATIEMKESPADDESLNTGEKRTINRGQEDQVDIEMPLHKSGDIGAIGTVFGGGNAAPIEGNTNVIIGNEEYVEITTNIVPDETDVRDYYTRSGAEGSYVYTSQRPLAKSETTYYKRVVEDDTETYVRVDDITVGETDVSDYYIRSGEEGSYVYTSQRRLAASNTTYYRLVLGVDIRGNVYGGGNAANVSGDTNVIIGKETTTP